MSFCWFCRAAVHFLKLGSPYCTLLYTRKVGIHVSEHSWLKFPKWSGSFTMFNSFRNKQSSKWDRNSMVSNKYTNIFTSLLSRFINYFHVQQNEPRGWFWKQISWHLLNNFKELNWLPFPKRVRYNTCLRVYKNITGQAPEYVSRMSLNIMRGKPGQQFSIYCIFRDHIHSTLTGHFQFKVQNYGIAYWRILETAHQSIGLNANWSAIYSTITKKR